MAKRLEARNALEGVGTSFVINGGDDDVLKYRKELAAAYEHTLPMSAVAAKARNDRHKRLVREAKESSPEYIAKKEFREIQRAAKAKAKADAKAARKKERDEARLKAKQEARGQKRERDAADADADDAETSEAAAERHQKKSRAENDDETVTISESEDEEPVDEKKRAMIARREAALKKAATAQAQKSEQKRASEELAEQMAAFTKQMQSQMQDFMAQMCATFQRQTVVAATAPADAAPSKLQKASVVQTVLLDDDAEMN